MILFKCDLCDQVKECVQKEIDGRQYLCVDCWRPLEEKLKGKGRTTRQREMVYLPTPVRVEREEKERPIPVSRPKFGATPGDCTNEPRRI